MKYLNRALIITVAFVSINAAAESQIQVDCEADGITITGSLNKSESDKLSGSLYASGEKVPRSLVGTQGYSGAYKFVEAGKFYKNFDYEMVSFAAKHGADILEVKSYIALDGSLVQAAYINRAATTITCRFAGTR